MRMTQAQTKAFSESMAQIQVGKNYPCSVAITEMVKGKKMILTFALQSYLVGMYACIRINGELIQQTGDHDNKKFVGGLVRDMKKAVKRGAIVEIGSIFPVKSGD